VSARRSCLFHLVFFHVSGFRHQGGRAKRRGERGSGGESGGGGGGGGGGGRVGPRLFFARLASKGHRSCRGFACCPGEEIHFGASARNEEWGRGKEIVHARDEREREREREASEQEVLPRTARSSLRVEGEEAVCRQNGCLGWGRTRLKGRPEDEDGGG